MEIKKVVEILKFFKSIDDEIRFNEKEITYLNDKYYIGIGSTASDGMPKGKGVTSNPTESTVINIPQSVYDTMKELKAENKNLCSLKTEILKELNSLSYIHKFIIIDFYIKGRKWVQISEQIHYSTRQCKNIRKHALDKLAKKLTTNPIISKYDFPS